VAAADANVRRGQLGGRKERGNDQQHARERVVDVLVGEDSRLECWTLSSPWRPLMAPADSTVCGGGGERVRGARRGWL
jgi:hypothetical protein